MRTEIHPFRVALRSPFVTGGVSVRFRSGFLVSITAGGLTGWGEASPLPGWSRNSLLQTETALRPALEAIGTDAESAVVAVIASLEHAPHARAAVAGAWADLQARQAGTTLAAHLVESTGAGRSRGTGAGRAETSGDPIPKDSVHDFARGTGAGRAETSGKGRSGPAPYEEVAVNALVTADEPDDVGPEAHEAVEAGFRAVKLKVGRAEPATDVDRVRAARAGLGPEAELRLDANGAWDQATAVEVLGRVQDCNIAYCEEPVAGIEAIAAVGRRSRIPVAVDESIRTESDAVRALELGVSTLIVKPQALGGPDVALAIAARTREAQASVVVTSFLDSAVGLAHALHVAAAVDAAASHRQVHGLATAELLAEDLAAPPPIASGAMPLPSSSGLGVTPAPGSNRP